jgi:hypothetical protein
MFEGPKNEYKHISRDSEEFEESVRTAREEIKAYEENFRYTKDSVSKLLDMIDKAEKLEGLATTEEEKVRIQGVVEIGIGVLKNAYSFFLNKVSVKTAKNLLRDLSENQELSSELINISRAMRSGEDISGDLVVKIFRQRLKSNQKREETLSEKWEEIMSSVLHSTQGGIDAGLIKRTSAEMDTIFNGQSFEVFDPFFNDRFIDGYHNPQSETVGISLDSPLEDLPHMILHESLHALGGRTILNIKRQEVDGEKSKVQQQKSGLVFLNNDKRTHKFNWLNEAVTEEITKELTGKESGYYVSHRRKLKRLYELGIDREIIYNAYFEDYNPDDPERVPHWKKFVAELKRIFPDLSVVEALEKVSNDVDEEIRQEKSNEKTQS